MLLLAAARQQRVSLHYAQAGRFDTIPPRFNGGNIDIRELTMGAKLYLPVHVEGAHFSTADCHAAQGDGEATGTGIETPMTVTLRFNLRQYAIRELQFSIPSPLTRADSQDYYCTTAHGADLYANAQNAVRYMIDWLVATYGLSRTLARITTGRAAYLGLIICMLAIGIKTATKRATPVSSIFRKIIKLRLSSTRSLILTVTSARCLWRGLGS